MKFIHSEKLSHLSSSEIEVLYQRYIQGENIQKLLTEYNIDSSPSRLNTLFPAIESKEHFCPYCQRAMYQKRSSKTNQHIEHYFCLSCSHTLSFSYQRLRYQCACQNCKNAQRLAVQKQYENAKQCIEEKYRVDQYPLFPYTALTLQDKCFLYGLYLLNNDNDYFLPLNKNNIIPLTPTSTMAENIMLSFLKRNVLVISPTTEPNAFDDEDYQTADLYEIDWAINIKNEEEKCLTMEELGCILHNDLENQLFAKKGQIVELIDALLLDELHAYLNYKLDDLYLPEAPKKVDCIFKEILSNFSVSEIYYFIKKACEDALIFYSSGRSMGKKHAVNIIPSKILNLATRSKNEQWEKYSFNRHKTMPRSQISFVFFDLFLKGKTTDMGFYLNRSELCEYL